MYTCTIKVRKNDGIIRFMDKVFNGCKSKVLAAISNNMQFSLQVLPLIDDEGMLPEEQYAYDKIFKFLDETLKYKKLPPRAIEGMKKKWEKTNPGQPFVIKKQPSEILIILIAPVDSCVHVFMSVPESFQDLFNEYQVISDKHQNRTIRYLKRTAPPTTTTYKYSDDISRDLLSHLTDLGIYVVDEDSEDDSYHLEHLE
jgi:hypothetical protein